MPRGIGTSTGVNETLTGRSAHGVRFCSISGVCRCTPPTPYARGRAHHLGAEQVRLGCLAGARRAADRDHHHVAGVDETGATAGSRARVETVG